MNNETVTNCNQLGNAAVRRDEGEGRRCPNKGYWCMKRRCWCEGECDLTAGKTADKTENKTQQGETR